METKILSRIGAGRSQRRRTDLIGSLGKLLFCLLLAGSFVLGQAPAQVAHAASTTVGCGDSAGLIGAIQTANATAGADTHHARRRLHLSALGCQQQRGRLQRPARYHQRNYDRGQRRDDHARGCRAPRFRIFHVARHRPDAERCENGTIVRRQTPATGGGAINSAGG